MSDYQITVTLKDVGEGDARIMANGIWKDNVEDYDAERDGSFSIEISRDGSHVIWDPPEDSADI